MPATGGTPARGVAHGRSDDGRDYTCGHCGAPIPDGALVFATYGSGSRPTGVQVRNADGEVLHTCGQPLPDGV